MLTPTSSRPSAGRSHLRRWLSGAVTLLAALAAVVGLAGLQVPAATAGVARAAVASHPAAAQLHASHDAASAPRHTARLKPVVRAAVRHDTSPPLRSIKPSKKLKHEKFKVLPVRGAPHMIGGAMHARTADV